MSQLKQLADHELLPDLISGSEDVFTVFFERYNRTVYHFIYKYVHSKELADDLTQEVFIKLWNNRKQLSEVQSFKGYLMVTARNHTFNSLKAAMRSDIVMGEVIRNFIEQRTATDERLLNADYMAFLERELAKLPERSREIFEMCRKQNHTYEEVAEALGISKSAVKNHMVYAMKTLRLSVEKELGISLTVLLMVYYSR